jgi:alpha-1,6-mannosyltransferase
MTIVLEEAPAASEATEHHVLNRAERVGRPLWAWLRLAGVLLLAGLSELVYVGFWPISYYLTQATDFSYEYLVRYPAIWDRLQLLVTRLETLWPAGPRSLDFLVDSLMALFVAAFCLYLLAFALAQLGLPNGWGAAVVVGSAIAFQATLFLMPGLFTTDLFSYVIYGQIAGVHGFNPYIWLPAHFPNEPIVSWIHPLWHYAPSIYGPAWVDISWFVARGSAGLGEVDKVLVYKLLVNLAHLGGVAALAFAVHRLRPGAVVPSVLLYAWNPLILFEFGGNGHNDAVMVSAMLLAVALFAGRQRVIGLIVLTVSFLMKMSSVLVLPYYVIAWARERRSLPGFALTLVVAGVTVLGVVAAFYVQWWVGIETVGPILTWTQGPMYNNYVPDIGAQWLASQYLMDPLAPDPAAALEESRGWVKTAGRTVFAAYCLWELYRVRGGLGLAGAGARVMVGFLLIVNTWVLPWYYTWPLALAAIVGWESITAKVLVGFSLSVPTAMYFHHFWHPYMSDWVYLIYLAPLCIIPIELGARALRRFRAATVSRVHERVGSEA